MKVYSLAVLAFMVGTTAMKAQNSFTQQLEQDVEGQGTIILEQDPRLTEIVNGEVVVPSSVTITKATSISTESKVKQDTDLSGIRAAGMHYKVRGYRVQVYFGGNLRSDQTKAQQAGAKATSAFPELRAYTTLSSPHWRCRVGDFATRDEATAYMRKLKARGFSEAIVVTSEIYVTKQQIRKESR